MKCEVCKTEVRFSKKDELFFHTPEGFNPCAECLAKFEKIRNWSGNLQVQLPLQVVADLNNKISELKTVVDALKGTKKNKKGWFCFK